jgi:hypothetical protein
MKIEITGDPVIDNLKSRRETTVLKIRELAYERLQLTRRVEDIDKFVGQLEGASVANDLVQKDIDTRRAIAEAAKETAEKKETAEVKAEKVTKKEVQ